MAIDWTRGYSCEWRVLRVDPATWTDAMVVPGFVSATVTRETDGTMERTAMELTARPDEEFAEGWYRLSMLALQDGTTERADVSTMWCSVTEDAYARGATTRSVEGRSPLWPVASQAMPIGSYAPAGSDGAAWVAQRIAERTPAPVVVRGGFALDTHVVFEQGATALDACRQVLDAGGYVLMLDGDGTITICEPPDEPALVLDSAGARLLQPEADRKADWTEVPNRYVAALGSRVAEAVNVDVASPTSIAARGFVVDAPNSPDTSPVLVGGETLDAYCARRLSELSTVGEEHSYKREWWPGVSPGSLVRGSLASVGIDGDMRVTSQQLGCGRGIVVEETAEREVRSWPTS